MLTKVNEDEMTQEVNFKHILVRLITNWKLYLLFIAICVLAAFLIVRYSTRTYKVTAKILVKDTKKGGYVPGVDIFSELDMFNGQNSVDNEVELLKSRTLMESTVKKLNLNVKYFAVGKIKSSELHFRKLPFHFNVIDLFEDSIREETDIVYTPSESSFSLTIDEQEKSYKYSDTVKLNFGKFIFIDDVSEDNTPIVITFIPFDQAVNEFRSLLSISPTTKTVSTIDLSLEETVPKRGEDLLNTLLSIYNKTNIEDKNKISDSTIAFIDDRLKLVNSELEAVEQDIQVFRKTNQLTDISEQGKLLLENTSTYSKELLNQEVQIKVLQLLEKHLIDTATKNRLVPASLNINDPTFVSLVQSYNNLQLERDKRTLTIGANNPYIKDLEFQVANLRKDLLSYVGVIKNSMLVNRNNLQARNTTIEKQMSEVPSKERAYIEFSRQQNIKQELYLYLLKKKEETAVSKSANIDNARIVDSGKSSTLPFKPRTSIIYLSAIIMGILIPTAILYFRELLNNKIRIKEDVSGLSQIPIIAEIGRAPKKNGSLVADNPRSVISEQLRLLQTNLQYLKTGTAKAKVILITSSMGGEGKSFLANNFSHMLANSGKRVALLEFDLRKPKISSFWNLTNSNGISNYIVKNLSPADIIKSVEASPNLKIISSGPIPPNPVDLIDSPRITELFSYLRENFDIIIVDSPPVGLVTDALVLEKYCDITVYIVRQNYTYKNQVVSAEELNKLKRMKNMSIVINDVDLKKSSYQYGYKYGYGYGYSEN